MCMFSVYHKGWSQITAFNNGWNNTNRPIYIKDHELTAASSIHTRCWFNNMHAFHCMWKKKPLRRCLFHSGSRYSLLIKKEDARDYFNFISICHHMKFDPLIIATDGVRFRLCRCQKILEKYNKRPFNILKESSYLDGQIFLVRPTWR